MAKPNLFFTETGKSRILLILFYSDICSINKNGIVNFVLNEKSK